MNRCAFVLALTLALGGCGYVGDPMPPTLDIPQAVVDLRVLEYGDRILVDFTLSGQTTEGLALTKVASLDVFAGPGGIASVDEWAASAKRYSLPDPKTGPIQYEIPTSDWVGRDIQLRVRAVGPKGRASAWSNLASLSVIEPPAVPSNLRAEAVAQGVALAWQGAGPRFRILRTVGEESPLVLGEVDEAAFVDESTAYGTRYRYQVQALASASQLGALTEAVAIVPEDVFPPAAPADVSALAATQSIELSWTRNAEEDFAGYSVYRAVDSGSFGRVATGLDAPTFGDPNIEAGKRYRYAVTAYDQKGNESARSMIVEIVAQ